MVDSKSIEEGVVEDGLIDKEGYKLPDTWEGVLTEEYELVGVVENREGVGVLTEGVGVPPGVRVLPEGAGVLSEGVGVLPEGAEVPPEGVRVLL